MTEEEGSSTPQRSREELVNRFIELSSAVSSQMRPAPSEVWSEVELTLYQFRALSLLSREPLRVTDLSARLGVRPSSAASLVQRLEEKGLLETTPDPADPHVTWCQLTPQGRQETENLLNVNRNLLASLADSLTDEELRAVVETFEILASALRRGGPGASP